MDGTTEKNDPLFQKPLEDIIGALASAGLLNHHRNQAVHICVYWIFHSALPILKDI